MTTPRPATELTADEARRIALRAQGFLGAPDRSSGVRGVLRSPRRGPARHHLGPGPLPRAHPVRPPGRRGPQDVENAYWTTSHRIPASTDAPPTPPHAFEYWSHAACILPIEEWPHFAFRRRAYRNRPHWNHELPDGAYDQVIKQLRTEGPLTATELGGAKRTSEWWDWSGTKVAVERALMYGEVVCVERRGWKRVYDLAERAIPETLLHDDLDDAECLRRLVRLAGRVPRAWARARTSPTTTASRASRSTR